MVQRRLLVSVMIGSIILLMVAACGGTGSQNASQRSENLPSATVSDDRSRNLPQKANETVTATDEYHPSGAIAKSRELKGRSSRLREEASSQFGLYLWPSDENEYEQIRDRLFANETLASALRTTTDEGVSVDFERRFYVGTGLVAIEVDATDQEIIEFLTTYTSEAKTRRIAFGKLREEASQFGLYLWPSDEDKYEQIRDRLFANEELASALRGAEREGVTVGLGREFHIGSAKVTIDVDATDQEIIEFLLGE